MKFLAFIAFVILSATAFAQDIHFSQFYAAPFNYNPAQTGQFDGDYRFLGNQRTQWRSVTVPYSTLGLAADANLTMGSRPAGAGISVYQDRAGDSRLSTLKVNLNGSYTVLQDDKHRIIGGLHAGITHQSIDYTALQFDNQWNGVAFDPGISPSETFGRNTQTFVNLSIGGLYRRDFATESYYSVGLAAFNLLRPQQTYFSDNTIRLDSRLAFSGEINFPVNDEWKASAHMLFQTQGKFREMLLGGQATNILKQDEGLYRTVFGGIYYRTRDAGYLLLGMDYDDWRVGLSYDINLSGLRPASHARGGFEISVVYILRKFRPYLVTPRFCPEFI